MMIKLAIPILGLLGAYGQLQQTQALTPPPSSSSDPSLPVLVSLSLISLTAACLLLSAGLSTTSLLILTRPSRWDHPPALPPLYAIGAAATGLAGVSATPAALALFAAASSPALLSARSALSLTPPTPSAPTPSPPSSIPRWVWHILAAFAAFLAALGSAKADANRSVFASPGGMLLGAIGLAGHVGALLFLEARVRTSPRTGTMVVVGKMVSVWTLLGKCTLITGLISGLVALLTHQEPHLLTSIQSHSQGYLIRGTLGVLLYTLAWSFFLAKDLVSVGAIALAMGHASLLLASAWLDMGWDTGSGLLSRAHAFRSLVFSSIIFFLLSTYLLRRLSLSRLSR